MMRFFLVILIFLLGFGLKAKNNTIINLSSQYKVVLQVYLTDNVYGWSFDTKKDKWLAKHKSIRDIDKYDDISLFVFYYDNAKYVAFFKEYKSNKKNLLDIYIMDFEKYFNTVKNCNNYNEALIKIPVLSKYTILYDIESKNKPLDLNINTVKNVDDEFLMLQFKVEIDYTVKFLFYSFSCLSSDNCKIDNLNNQIQDNIDSLPEIGTIELYNNFFYKMMDREFMDFIQSPLSC